MSSNSHNASPSKENSNRAAWITGGLGVVGTLVLATQWLLPFNSKPEALPSPSPTIAASSTPSPSQSPTVLPTPSPSFSRTPVPSKSPAAPKPVLIQVSAPESSNVVPTTLPNGAQKFTLENLGTASAKRFLVAFLNHDGGQLSLDGAVQYQIVNPQELQSCGDVAVTVKLLYMSEHKIDSVTLTDRQYTEKLGGIIQKGTDRVMLSVEPNISGPGPCSSLQVVWTPVALPSVLP